MDNQEKSEQKNNRELERVAGGNYGDSEKEFDGHSIHFMYNVGDVVEVYQYKIHISDWGTRRGTIIRRYPYRDVYDGWGAYYDVKYDDNGYVSTMVQADDILR